jgi:hypothetical protein
LSFESLLLLLCSRETGCERGVIGALIKSPDEIVQRKFIGDALCFCCETAVSAEVLVCAILANEDFLAIVLASRNPTVAMTLATQRGILSKAAVLPLIGFQRVPRDNSAE